MAYKLGAVSLKNLRGVHPDLVKVVQRAIEITAVDFRVIEGLRTLKRQRQLVAKGASQTMRSRHLTGHAVDLAALVGGATRWDWPLYYRIADAVRQAAVDTSVPIEWGAAWDRLLNSYASADDASDEYVEERRRQGKRPFLDGPHFQLPWSKYPG
jgi:peptidoglycan L-alanyl-D-glutamate endopeptidase CwlK